MSIGVQKNPKKKIEKMDTEEGGGREGEEGGGVRASFWADDGWGGVGGGVGWGSGWGLCPSVSKKP